jgi:hypothetical protein
MVLCEAYVLQEVETEKKQGEMPNQWAVSKKATRSLRDLPGPATLLRGEDMSGEVGLAPRLLAPIDDELFLTVRGRVSVKLAVLRSALSIVLAPSSEDGSCSWGAVSVSCKIIEVRLVGELPYLPPAHAAGETIGEVASDPLAFSCACKKACARAWTPELAREDVVIAFVGSAGTNDGETERRRSPRSAAGEKR